MISSKSISLILTCAAFLLPGALSGAERQRGLFPDARSRATLSGIYKSVYEKNPSMLSWWDYDVWSVIGTEAHAGKGKLHSPTSPDGSKGLNINTESILHQKNTGWTFSGKFEYGIDWADSVRSTLSYRKRPYGSPSMFFCIAPASSWELQHYTLAATASKRLGSRWSAGAHLEYVGGKQFRKSDVRNEQTSLDISLEAGATGLFGRNLLSAGLSYERYKEKPEFSRVYNSGADYFIYLMNGLGTQVTGQENSPSWRQNVPGVYVSWGHHGAKNRITARYSFKIGEDCWKSEAIQSSTRQEKFTNYDFMFHSVSLSDLLTLSGERRLIFDGDFSFVSGESSNWSKSTSSFIADYDALLYEGRAGVRYSNPGGWFRAAGINAILAGESRHDKNYDARLDDMNLCGTAMAGFGAKIGKTDLDLTLSAGLSTWLQADYQPNAAKDGYNIYTTYIGKAEEAFLDAGQWHAGAELSVEFPVRKTLLSVGAAYNYAGAVADNVYKGARRQYGNIFLNICF